MPGSRVRVPPLLSYNAEARRRPRHGGLRRARGRHAASLRRALPMGLERHSVATRCTRGRREGRSRDLGIDRGACPVAKTPIRDLVVLLPGITGSVLQKDGRDVWAPAGKAISRALFSRGNALQALRLAGDDPERDELDDGIRATRVVPDAHLVPGLVKIDGYTAITRLIVERFEVVQGVPDQPAPANYFELPYD